MDFGEALRRTMFEFRISGAKLGRETGVNSSQISEFKNGGASLSVVNLHKVVRALTPEQQAFYFSLVGDNIYCVAERNDNRIAAEGPTPYANK